MTRFVVSMRLMVVALILIALVATLTDTSGLVPESYFDLASYYTFQTNIVCALILVILTWYSARHEKAPLWVEYGRAFCAVNLVVLAVIYWAMIFPLGTEDGAQMFWVMVISHIVTPVYLGVEYVLVGDRRPLPLRHWWIIAGYAGVWTVATVIRSEYGSYVAYDHLDPGQRSYLDIASVVALHSALLIALTVTAMRLRRFRSIPEPAHTTELVEARVAARTAASRVKV